MDRELVSNVRNQAINIVSMGILLVEAFARPIPSDSIIFPELYGKLEDLELWECAEEIVTQARKIVDKLT